MKLLKIFIVALTLATGLTSLTSAIAQAVPQGAAMPIGGGLKPGNDEVWSRIVALAGGPGARFVVFGTASEYAQASADEAVEGLNRRGAKAEALPVSPLFKEPDARLAVRDPALIAKVRMATGVYFTGGSQDRIVDTFMPGGVPSPMLEAIWAVYRAGGVVAGTSAGAAIMSRVMFRDAPDVLAVMKGQWNEGQEVGAGLGFVGPDLFVDQHFLTRGRFGRMIPVMWAKGFKLGLGVDEDSAAVIQGRSVEVIGGKGAMLVDLRGATTDGTVNAFNLTGVRMSYLDHGDRLMLDTGVITPSAQKLRGQVLDPASPTYKPYYTAQPFYIEMFGNTTIANAMGYLMDSHQAELRGLAFDALPRQDDPQPQLGFSFRLYKGPGTIGWTSDEAGPDEYSVAGMYLDIAPVRIAQPFFTPWADNPARP